MPYRIERSSRPDGDPSGDHRKAVSIPAFEPAGDDWDLARDLYIAGQAGEQVCRTLGLSPATFWRRAARDGWLRRDGVATARPVDFDAAPIAVDDALDAAWRRAAAALDAGDAADSLRWLKIHGLLVARQASASLEQERKDRAEVAANQRAVGSLRGAVSEIASLKAEIDALEALARE